MSKLTNVRFPVLLVAVIALVAVGCQAPAPTPTPEPPDHAADLRPAFDAYVEAWNTQNYDEIPNHFVENFRRIAPDQNVDSRDGLLEFMQQVHATYPDFNIVPGESAYLENLSFNQWTATGTTTLEDGTQAAIEVDGMTMVRYADGKITEEWVYFDTAQLTDSIGAIPHAN